MKASVLIVEDQFIEANNLKLILKKAGYSVFPIAHSVNDAWQIMERQNPEIVLLDIRLQGDLTGIDLARSLKEKNIAFVYLSANSDKPILDAAIATKPYGFLVKPFREKDVLVMLDVAWYLHQHNQESVNRVHDHTADMPGPLPGDEFPNIIGKSFNFFGGIKKCNESGPIGDIGPDTGRKRYRKGIDRPGHPSYLSPAGKTADCRQLCGASCQPDRSRIIRT